MTAHKKSGLCGVEEPHQIADCGEFTSTGDTPQPQDAVKWEPSWIDWAESDEGIEAHCGVPEEFSPLEKAFKAGFLAALGKTPDALPVHKYPWNNRYWDIFKADDGGRLLRICCTNASGNFQAMEVAEFVTWNGAEDQSLEEQWLLKIMNATEARQKDREWLMRQAAKESATFATPDAGEEKEK